MLQIGRAVWTLRDAGFRNVRCRRCRPRDSLKAGPYRYPPAYEPGMPLPSQSPLRPRSCASALFAHSLPSWECGWPASVDRKLHGQGTANMWSEATSSKRHTEYLYLCDLGLVGAAAKRGFGVQRRIKRARITIQAFENSTQTARAKTCECERRGTVHILNTREVGRNEQNQLRNPVRHFH